MTTDLLCIRIVVRDLCQLEKNTVLFKHCHMCLLTWFITAGTLHFANRNHPFETTSLITLHDPLVFVIFQTCVGQQRWDYLSFSFFFIQCPMREGESVGSDDLAQNWYFCICIKIYIKLRWLLFLSIPNLLLENSNACLNQYLKEEKQKERQKKIDEGHTY